MPAEQLNPQKLIRSQSSRLSLVIKEAEARDRGTFSCEATKDGVKATAEFSVSVFIPAVCTHEDGTKFEQGKIYNPNRVKIPICLSFTYYFLLPSFFSTTIQ